MNQWLRYAVIVAFVATPAVAVDVRYEVALRTDLRARNPLPGDLGTPVTGDLEFIPRAQLSLGLDASTLQFLYAPTLLWREPQQGAQSQFLPLQRGRVAFDTHWSRGTFHLSEDAAYGQTYVGALRNPEGSVDPVTEVQSLGIVRYLRSFTAMGLEGRPSDHLTLGVLVGYQVSGSTGPPPEQNDPNGLLVVSPLPLQYGPTALATARATVTRLDGLTTAAQVSQAHFVTGADQLVAQLRETWDRQLSRTTTFTLGAGAALAREAVVATTLTPNSAGTYLDLLPVASVGLDWRDVLSEHPIRLDTSLRMAPFADRFTGAVYERVELRGHGEWRFAKDWVSSAAAGGAIAVPVSLALMAPENVSRLTQVGDRVIYAEGTVIWAVKTWLLLQASARVLWTEQPRFQTSGVQAVGTVSVTVQQQDSLAW